MKTFKKILGILIFMIITPGICIIAAIPGGKDLMIQSFILGSMVDILVLILIPVAMLILWLLDSWD